MKDFGNILTRFFGDSEDDWFSRAFLPQIKLEPVFVVFDGSFKLIRCECKFVLHLMK
jgi:hypothetical protein